MINWKEVYAAPFNICEMCSVHVKDSNNNVAFNKVDDIVNELLDKLNGTSDKKYNAHREGIWVYVDGRRVMMIRGWGRLSSLYKLDSKEASTVQDEFGDWVIKKLKE